MPTGQTTVNVFPKYILQKIAFLRSFNMNGSWKCIFDLTNTGICIYELDMIIGMGILVRILKKKLMKA